MDPTTPHFHRLPSSQQQTQTTGKGWIVFRHIDIQIYPPECFVTETLRQEQRERDMVSVFLLASERLGNGILIRLLKALAADATESDSRW